MKDIINGFYEYNVKLNKSELTIKTYIENIEKFISDYNFTTENLDRLSSSEFIQEWLNDQINKGYQPGTINKKKNIISVFANYLMLNDIIKSNKFKEMSAMRNDAVKTDIYTDEDINKMMKYLDDKIEENNFGRKVDLKVYKMQRCIINILITTGLRISEVVKMKMDDFDLDNSNIFMVRGKGYKEKVSRKNAFTEEVANQLREYLEIRAEINIAECDKDYLFISPLNHKHITDNTVRRFVKRMFEILGIEGTLHEFRRTKGSNLIAKGIEIEKVSKFLGHQNIATTERFYVKNVNSVVEDLVNM